MENLDKVAVVGGTGYTGREIVRILLRIGRPEIRILTGHPTRPHPFGERVKIFALNFENKSELRRALKGVRFIYNTYWVRFRRGNVSFEGAVSNTAKLFDAAREEGVERVVHISITNPSLTSPYGYFKGKAQVEELLKKSGLSYAILRPTIIFGLGDILINNMAWVMRRFRFFPLFGSGKYRVTPVYVGDVASACVRYAHEEANLIRDCVGPETYTFRDLLKTIGSALGIRALIFAAPKGFTMFLGKILSLYLGEPIVTGEEVGALMDGLLCSDAQPLGLTRFSEWVSQNSQVLGLKFASEIQRHYS
ncbi:MAG: NAD(P)H-binding protein [Thermoprotei archaeon]